MLGDSDEKTRILGVDKVLSILQKLSSSALLNNSAIAECHNEERFSESACDTSSTVRIFDLPIDYFYFILFLFLYLSS